MFNGSVEAITCLLAIKNNDIVEQWSDEGDEFELTVFNIDPDLCNMRHLHQAHYGFMDVTIEYSRPLSEPIYVLYEKVFPKVVVNDKLSNTLSVLDVEA